MENRDYIYADDIIGRMAATIEEAREIIDRVEQDYFSCNTSNTEMVQKIAVEYTHIGIMLRASLDLLHVAQEENLKWQNRPEDQIKEGV